MGQGKWLGPVKSFSKKGGGESACLACTHPLTHANCSDPEDMFFGLLDADFWLPLVHDVENYVFCCLLASHVSCMLIVNYIEMHHVVCRKSKKMLSSLCFSGN